MLEHSKEQDAAEEYLMNLRTIGKRIRAVDEEIRQLRLASTNIGAINYDKEHVDGGPREEKLVLFISDIMEFQVKREELYAQSDLLKAESYKIIRSLQDASERIFLESYYINALSMENTINKMYVSRRKVYYIKNNALQHFGELLKSKKDAAV